MIYYNLLYRMASANMPLNNLLHRIIVSAGFEARKTHQRDVHVVIYSRQ